MNTYDRLIKVIMEDTFGIPKTSAERIASELLERFDINPHLVELSDGDIFQRQYGGDTIVWVNGVFHGVCPQYPKLSMAGGHSDWNRIHSRAISLGDITLKIEFDGDGERIR